MDKKGLPSLEQRYASGDMLPTIAARNSLKLVYGYQDTSQTNFIFQKSVQSPCAGQTEADIIIDGTGQWIIFAKGESNKFEKHLPINRGNKFIDFSSSQNSSSTVISTDIQTISVNVKNFTVPVTGGSTQYCYSFYKLPSNSSYQLIQYSPILTSKKVHHMILYSCTVDVSTQFMKNNVQCVSDSSMKAPGRDQCEVQWTIAAPGTVPRILPSNMGKIWSRMVLLEIHYNNPSLEANVLDSSGFSLTYTSQLRPISVGVMALGKF